MLVRKLWNLMVGVFREDRLWCVLGDMWKVRQSVLGRNAMKQRGGRGYICEESGLDEGVSGWTWKGRSSGGHPLSCSERMGWDQVMFSQTAKWSICPMPSQKCKVAQNLLKYQHNMP